MHANHYAVLIGVSGYPDFGDPPPNLQSPGNDIDLVRRWLVSPRGGGLPPDGSTIRESRSPTPTGSLKPTSKDIEDCFIWLYDEAEEKKPFSNPRLGQRLYVYLSGHGFSPGPNKGCLYSAEARLDIGRNVWATAWLEWFQDAGYFREYVLWMDCCMNRMSAVQPIAALMVPQNVPEPPGPTFVAFAARRPLKAVEAVVPEDGGKTYGIFTWSLIEGLNGAAANQYGSVTGHSLANWLRNSLRARMSPADLADADVSKEPEIVREDDHLIFAKGLKVREYDVTFRGPAKTDVRIWSGRPPAFETHEIPASGTLTVSLAPGVYVAEAAGERSGFEVTRSCEVSLQGKKDAVTAAAKEIFRLTVDLNDASTEIFVVDEAFQLVDGAAGKLESDLPFGIYKIRIRSGRRLIEHIVILDKATRLGAEEMPALPQFSSAAPLPETANTHEYHQEAITRSLANPALSLANPALSKVLSGQLIVMARSWSKTGNSKPARKPWEGIQIFDQDEKEIVGDFEQHGETSDKNDPYGVVSLPLAPGTYFLRQHMSDELEYEQALTVCEGWRTEAFLLQRPSNGDNEKPRPRLSILMHRPGSSWADADDKLVDQARVALGDERIVLNEVLDSLLLRKFTNPIAGIIGGHLLLIEHRRYPTQRITLLNEVVAHLRDLVGNEHPDVEALSLRCTDESLRATRGPKAPPMFEASWRLLVEASRTKAALVSQSLWRRVHAQASFPPYFSWVSSSKMKSVYREELARTLQTQFRTLDNAFAPQASLGAGAAHVAVNHLEGTAASRSKRREVAKQMLRELGLPAAALKTLRGEF